MKSVLIIGESSYIGKSFAEYTKCRYNVNTVSGRDEQWKTVGFSGHDSVLHCAGIAHVPKKTVDEQEYYRINCDLAVEVAKKARNDGVSQFIFLSSMSVYGSASEEIDMNTVPKPETPYGASKLVAEKELKKLENGNFKICVIRPPMVYGFGCKGNFPKLAKLAMMTPLFPDINNKRSMIYIDNLCELFCQAIDCSLSGLYLPQNSGYVNTTELVKYIAHINNKRLLTIKLFNPLVFLMARFVPAMDKLFGNLTYVHTELETLINVIGFEESIKRSL